MASAPGDEPQGAGSGPSGSPGGSAPPPVVPKRSGVPDAELNRTRIVGDLRDALAPLPWAHAMWEAGAAAHGRIDQWSDIDLMVVVDDDRQAALFEVVEAAMRHMSSIELRYELPQPSWHGHMQVFYRLRDTSPYLFIDLCAMKLSSEKRFLEPERHGRAVVHFDKSGVVDSAEQLDRAVWQEKLRERVESLRSTFPLFQVLVLKELARDNDIEAIAFYQSMTLRPLIDLLRIRHDPFKFDYGTRYVHYDLPDDVVAQLRELYFVRDPDDLARKREAAERLFAATLAQLDAQPADV